MPLLRPRNASIALPFALCLTGCGAVQTVLAPRTEVAAELLVCPAQPSPPATLTTDTDLTDWTLAVIDAGAECRDKLRRVGDILKAAP